MALYRPRYRVELDPTQPPVEVTISSGDMLRAELEMSRMKLAAELVLHTTVLWVWSAMVRAGLEDRKAGEFLADPPEFEPVRDATGQTEVELVDPTPPGSGATDSGLLPSLAAAPTTG